MSRDKLERILSDFQIDFCQLRETNHFLKEEIKLIKMTADQILSSGYVHRDEVLRCLPKKHCEIILAKEHRFQCERGIDCSVWHCKDKCRNQAIGEVRQALENLGGGE